MAKRAFSEIRNVIVTFDNGTDAQLAMPIDAYKAALERVAQLESDYLDNPSLANLAGADVAITGTQKYKLYHFELTTTFATGTYEFVFVETVPNADSLS